MTQPSNKVIAALSFLLVLIAAGISLLVLRRPDTPPEVVGIILAAWLGGAGLGGVTAFWFGSSLGARTRAPATTTVENVENATVNGGKSE